MLASRTTWWLAVCGWVCRARGDYGLVVEAGGGVSGVEGVFSLGGQEVVMLVVGGVPLGRCLCVR